MVLFRRRKEDLPNPVTEEIAEMKVKNALSHLRVLTGELEKSINRLDDILHIRNSDKQEE